MRTGIPVATMEAGNSRLEPLRLPRAAGMVPLELRTWRPRASRSSAPFSVGWWPARARCARHC